ncbi:MAG: sodium:proton antiporter [Coriobacteriia bacterium]|nr:sodium:proton antiporter [Coriobacteriia bacterium]MBN2822180.1 sodium:proton antiporter [Coriobacteriia bacterium]
MKKALVAALLILAAIPLLLAVSELPPHGSASNATYTHVSAYYLEHGAEEAGAENIITDVILNYRGFDTNGEVTVIFTALAAVLAVLLLGDASTATEDKPSHSVSVVVSFIVRLLAPFIAMFAVYVIINGHISPGGGFQGGTILGALAIVLTLVLGEDEARRLLPERPKPWLQAAAPLTFIGIGLAGLTDTGFYLGFPTAEALSWIRTMWLLAIEIGIGVGGAAIIASIFWTMEAER